MSKEQAESGFDKFGAMINWDEINELLGVLLTYVDATYSDNEQRKAHKSLLKNAVRDWYNRCEEKLPVKARGLGDYFPYSLEVEYQPWDTQSDGVLPETIN